MLTIFPSNGRMISGRAGCCRAGHQHSAYQKQHSAQCCGKFFHLVFSAYPFYAGKASLEVYHIFSPLKRDLHIPLSHQHRLQLLTPQSGVHGGGQQGKISLQALGLGKGVVLPVGHKVIVLALA